MESKKKYVNLVLIHLIQIYALIHIYLILKRKYIQYKLEVIIASFHSSFIHS